MQSSIVRLYPLATKLYKPDIWMQDPFDWEAHQHDMAANNVDEFFTLWDPFELSHNLHMLFCQQTQVDFTKAFAWITNVHVPAAACAASESDVPESTVTYSMMLDTIRLAVISAALIETGSEPLDEGKSRHAVMQDCKQGLVQSGFTIPAQIGKVVRQRQAELPQKPAVAVPAKPASKPKPSAAKSKATKP